MRPRAIGVAILLIVGTATLTGCYGRYLDVPLKSEHIAMCPRRLAPYPVTDIPKHAPVPCDIGGETLILPNGYEMIAPRQGMLVGGGALAIPTERPGAVVDDQYSVLDFGTYGMIVGELNPHTCKTVWWGTAEGLARYWAAFGKSIQDDQGGKCQGTG